LSEKWVDYAEEAVREAAKKRLPLCLTSTQWEVVLYRDKKYRGLPADENPCYVDTEGKVRKAVSPFGPTEHWRRVGTEWTDTEQMKALRDWYPDPPYVIMLSNNEAKALGWKSAEKSRRFLRRHGEGKSENFRRRVFGEGYIERYNAMFDGMRTGAAEWGDKLRFVGYAYDGRADLVTLRRRFTPFSWDGTSLRNYMASYDGDKTDYTGHSPQVAAMNQIILKEWYQTVKPDCWWEVSTWWDDRWNKKAGEEAGRITPERYGGMVTWAMWLGKVRVLRHFTGWTTLRENDWDKYSQVVEAVDSVHENPVLREFWREGRPVRNPETEINIHADIKDPRGDVPREKFQPMVGHYYGLSTSLDPEKPEEEAPEFGRNSKFWVWAQAQVIGQKPERRWLVFAHAPREDKEDVRITIPGHGEITMDVPQGGAYAVVREKDGVVEKLNEE
jgi:hypothetical protein